MEKISPTNEKKTGRGKEDENGSKGKTTRDSCHIDFAGNFEGIYTSRTSPNSSNFKTSITHNTVKNTSLTLITLFSSLGTFKQKEKEASTCSDHTDASE